MARPPDAAEHSYLHNVKLLPQATRRHESAGGLVYRDAPQAMVIKAGIQRFAAVTGFPLARE